MASCDLLPNSQQYILTEEFELTRRRPSQRARSEILRQHISDESDRVFLARRSLRRD
jgi:hypothetical protein